MGPARLDIFAMVGNAGLMVQFVMLLLLFFSITSWAIILVKWLYFRKAFRQSSDFTEFFWKSRDLSEAFARSKRLKGSPVARVFRVGYLDLKKVSQSGRSATGAGAGMQTHFQGVDTVKRSLRRAINSEMTRTAQMVPFLATTGNTTPFIGLFGTVWGIMNSFHGIGLRGSASLAVVAPGISEALIATAAGLAAAIPAVIAYNYFTNKVGLIDSELNSFAADFLNIIERDILVVNGEGR
jgi:biopolymer transport protein TolQ